MHIAANQFGKRTDLNSRGVLVRIVVQNRTRLIGVACGQRKPGLVVQRDVVCDGCGTIRVDVDSRRQILFCC